LTLLNKGVMEFSKFRFPVTISFVHMAVSSFCAFVLSSLFRYDPGSGKRGDDQRRPDYEDTVWRRILNLSLLFSMNIIFGNSALRYCSVAFVQVVRAIIPMLTMLLSVVFLHQKFSPFHYLSCFVVCVGVAFSCFGEINLTGFGLFTTLTVCVLSSMKSVWVKLSLSGAYEIHPFDLLLRMSPIAGIEMFFFIVASGEHNEMVSGVHYQATVWRILGVLLTGLVAFVLNLTNFLATSHTSPLTVTIVGCVKQIVTIILSVIIFDKRLTWLNSFGVVVTTGGSLWYGLLNASKKAAPLPPVDPPADPRLSVL
jgi:drug/metabolite transporter (DMT)-like permease